MTSKPEPPPPPDYTPFITASQNAAASDAAAAEVQAQVAREQMAQQDIYAQRSADLAENYYQMAVDQAGFGREQYEDILPYLQTYMDSQNRYIQASEANLADQMESAALSRQQSQETYDRYVRDFAPRETQFVQEAFDYASPARMEQEAGAARADVTTAFSAARDRATRDLASYGIDPTQGRYAGATQAMDISEAAAGAAAGTMARRQIEQQGKQYELAALQTGRGLPTQAIGLGTLGVNQATAGLGGAAIGGGGISAANQGLYAGTAAMGSPTAYASLSNPYTQLAGVYGGQATGLYGNQISALGNIGSAIGAGAGAMNTSFGNQMSIYQQQAANAMAPWQAIGTIGGAVLPLFL